MDIIEQIKNILMQHRGKSNAITSGEIAVMVGINEDDTHAQTRAMILDAVIRYNLPLAADNTGYYLITNDLEYYDYMKNLNSRIVEISERKNLITRNYGLWKKQNGNS